MKRISYIIALTAAVVALPISSCNFLDEDPRDVKIAEKFWKTYEDAESGVNGLYFGGVPYLHNTDVDGGWTPKATMWGGIMSGLFVDVRKDRVFTTASESATFNVESFNSTAYKLWHEFYIGVSRANFVIHNVPRMTEVLDAAKIDNYMAQAKFFRAYSYFYLVKEFGDVPYIDWPFEVAENMATPKSSAAYIYSKIEADLLSIIDGNQLPDKAFYNNGCYVTRPMAQSLLAQVYLQWAGAPLNGGADKYTKAAEMATRVINGGKHALIQPNGSSDDLLSAFNVIKTTKSSNEIIYAKEYNQLSYNVGNSYTGRSIETGASQWGVFGNDFMYNAYLPCDMLLQSYESGDIRGHEKQFFFRTYTDKDGVAHNMGNIGNWAWFDEAAMIAGKDGDNNMPIIRYAEVLLIAAEGLARTGNDAEALGYLNQVRKRAGLTDETATGDALIQSILTERLHEFPLEFKVWDDIRRTRLYPEAAGTGSGKLNWVPLAGAVIQNKPARATRVGAIPEHALLWPIPLRELQANPALNSEQNPGWN
jgi:hypothetical protein